MSFTRSLALTFHWLLILSGSLHAIAQPQVQFSGNRDYVGRYALRDDLLLEVTQTDTLLNLLPTFWRTVQVLEPVGQDSFQSLLHPEIKFRFIRDAMGNIIELDVSGHREIGGKAIRLQAAKQTVVELLLSGEPERAFNMLQTAGELNSPSRALRLGRRLIGIPSKALTAAKFLGLAARTFPLEGSALELLGSAWLQVGKRDSARDAFRKAIELGQADPVTRHSARLLDSDSPSASATASANLSFSLDELFRLPTQSEIQETKNDWSQRRLDPVGMSKVNVHEILFHGVAFEVRILSHLVYGTRHYGAVLVPKGTKSDSYPVLVELRGVNWSYSPFPLEALHIPDILREDMKRVIIVVPSFRGETMTVGTNKYTSEGVPTNGWDGATDDAMAFLSVALSETPEADSQHVGVFGKSRGGTVALLMGARDKRIDCVVDWAGPADWFTTMGTGGWTLKEQVQIGLWEGWKPGQGEGSAGQFIEWCIESTQRSLEAARHRMIASSPLYFLENLPPTDLQYGDEDTSVPKQNALALEKVLASRMAGPSRFRVTRHPSAGHDMPYPDAYDISRNFLQKYLLSGRD